jgi:hypothetical protein
LKKIAQHFGVLLLLAMLPIIALAQNPIPNPGFEDWSGGNPVGWITSNVPFPPSIGVTQSNDSHGGSSSVRMEVLDFSGFPYPALLYAGDAQTGFPCQMRYESLMGYYKIQPQPEEGLTINVIMYQNPGQLGQVVIGIGNFLASSAATDWTQFSIPIEYFLDGEPDACLVQIVLGNEATPGGLAWIDDLEFGAAIPGGCCVGMSGNVDGDPSEIIDIGDITALIDYLFISFAVPECLAEANVDGDLSGVIDIGDVTALIDYLFISFALPAECLSQ